MGPVLVFFLKRLSQINNRLYLLLSLQTPDDLYLSTPPSLPEVLTKGCRLDVPTYFSYGHSGIVLLFFGSERRKSLVLNK